MKRLGLATIHTTFSPGLSTNPQSTYIATHTHTHTHTHNYMIILFTWVYCHHHYAIYTSIYTQIICICSQLVPFGAEHR
jgi:hypothetical protein